MDASKLEMNVNGKTAELRIYGEIGWEIVTGDIVKAIQSVGDVDEIAVYVNSPGGFLYDGVTIYNELKNHPASVTVYVYGLAASAASLVAMAGDRIVMGEGSLLMIHNAAGLTMGNAKDHEDVAKSLRKIDNEIARIYARRSGMGVREVKKLMDEETEFSPEEAVEAGFADEVMEDDNEEGEDNDMKNRAVAQISPVSFFNQTQIEKILAAVEKIHAHSGAKPGGTEISPKEKNMAEEKTPPGETKSAEGNVQGPRAASFAELKAAMPKADAQFICDQLERKATLDEARAAYVSAIEAKAEAALTAQAEAEKAKAEAEAKLAAPRPGVEALADGRVGEKEPIVDPIAKWEEAVAAQMKRGKNRASAIRAVVDEQPELQAAYIEAHNEKHAEACKR